MPIPMTSPPPILARLRYRPGGMVNRPGYRLEVLGGGGEHWSDIALNDLWLGSDRAGVMRAIVGINDVRRQKGLAEVQLTNGSDNQ